MAAEVAEQAVELVVERVEASASFASRARPGGDVRLQRREVGVAGARAVPRIAAHSSASRTNCASATAAGLISVTNVPSCGTIATSRSSRRRSSASRIGVRLTPSSSASSFSESCRPGSSSPETIASRSAA